MYAFQNFFGLHLADLSKLYKFSFRTHQKFTDRTQSKTFFVSFWLRFYFDFVGRFKFNFYSMFSTHSSFLSTRFSVFFVCAVVVVSSLHSATRHDESTSLRILVELCLCGRDTRAQETRICVYGRRRRKKECFVTWKFLETFKSLCAMPFHWLHECAWLLHAIGCYCCCNRNTQDIQALVLFRSDTRHATVDAHLFTPPGVYVCVAVDVLKFPFEFSVRREEWIARCMAFRMLHQCWKGIFG